LLTTAHKIWQSVLGRNVGFPLKAFLSGDKKAGRSFATFHSQTVVVHRPKTEINKILSEINLIFVNKYVNFAT